jgi:hypothetical protein
VYDLRFVFGAPALERVTRRREWTDDASLQAIALATELEPRLAAGNP